MADKLLPGNETVLLIPAIEVNGIPHLIGADLAPISAPTTAILNKWIAITSTSGSDVSGGNISCAVRDDMNLGATSSGQDTDRTLCSVGQSGSLTIYNFNAEFTIFVDADFDATGVYNLARDLTRAPDAAYVVAHRIGAPQTAQAQIGEEWDFYYAWTDNPVPGYGDNANQTIGVTLAPKGILNTAYELVA